MAETRVFNCVAFNSRSVVKKLLDLYFEVIVEGNSPDLIAICETWLSGDIPDSFFSLCKGYSVFRQDRLIGKGGGVALLVKTSVVCHSVSVPSDEFFESVCVLVKSGITNFLFCSVYRPPAKNNACLSSFTKLLNFLESYNLPIVIVGDLNLPNASWSSMTSSDSFTAELLRDLLSHGFTQYVNEPTREQNLLDVVLCSERGLVQDTRVKAPVGNSDHCSVNFKQ